MIQIFLIAISLSLVSIGAILQYTINNVIIFGFLAFFSGAILILISILESRRNK